jgi:spore coat protein H
MPHVHEHHYNSGMSDVERGMNYERACIVTALVGGLLATALCGCAREAPSAVKSSGKVVFASIDGSAECCETNGSSKAELLLAQAGPAKVVTASQRKERNRDASDDFFERGEIPRLKITIPQAELDRLRQDNRNYVRCAIKESAKTEYASVGIKLKGAAGSFRGVDDKPALTLNFDRFRDHQEFHGLDKIHLNNSVQDPTYLNELVCSELFLAGGIPTPRTTHARVWLNGRDLGLYVLKEGFDASFLKRHFKDSTGNLYDGGFLQDLDAALEKDSGDGPDDRSDLKTVVDATREGDAKKRWQRMAELVDVDRMLTFTALELMTCHWDGYSLNRNNYRVYFDANTKKMLILPHGMDQMFGDPNASVLINPGAMVPQAILSNPEWRAAYRDRIGELLPLFSPPDRLLKRADEVHARIRPVLNEWNAGAARDLDNQVRHLKERIAARAKSLAEQNNVPEPRPLKFDADGVAKVIGWKAKAETADAKFDEQAGANEPKSYRIEAGPGGRCVASWRAKVLLPAGKYKFEARGRTSEVAALAEQSGEGAGVRLSGAKRTNKLAGDSSWQPLEHAFEIIAPTQEVELVAELRATKGQVWFEADSLRVVRAK